jgi:8-oxo-dGTP pyrophosphatase MutT (NUDIX family)
MNFEPQKFFIGLVDFFSIFMPGALLTYLGKDWATSVLHQAPLVLDSTEAGIVFLFASYLLGHFAYLVGGTLDDWLYDPLRKATYWGQIDRLAKSKSLSHPVWRALAESKLLFDQSADRAVIQVARIKARTLRGLAAQNAINAYQWSKARLSKEHPEGLVAVQRFEADSKFFRSFVVVLAVLAAIYAVQREWTLALVCAGFLLPALWRYMDQRLKSTQQAYWFIIMLEGMKAAAPADGTSPDSDRLTHAGGVVFRQRDGIVEYLMVQASKNRDEWVLPKGRIEPGESPKETAVREVKEESGHWARVLQWVDDAKFGANSDTSQVRFYLMEAVEDTERAGKNPWPQENRGRAWMTLEEARKRAKYSETQSLLDKAERVQNDIEAAMTKKPRLLRAFATPAAAKRQQ